MIQRKFFLLFGALTFLVGCSSGVATNQKSVTPQQQLVSKPVMAPKATSLYAPGRRTLAVAALTEAEIRTVALTHAQGSSVFDSSVDTSKIQSSNDVLSAAKDVTPQIVGCEHKDYDAFNALRARLEGGKLDISNFPVWIIELKGHFRPRARTLNGKYVDHLLLAVDDSGRVVSRLEISREYWVKIMGNAI